MTKNASARLSLRALMAAVSLALLISNFGCAHGSPELRLTSLESKATYCQQFDKAYLSKGAGGSTQIVLVGDDRAGNADAALRQVMHVKVLWRPQRGTKQGHPSYTNAGLHWYVFSQDSSDVLEYSGAGFVALADAPGGKKVMIRNATLKPTTESSTSLNDPVGPARLTGSFVAKKSSRRVNDLLAEVKSATSGARAEQAAAR